MADRFVSQLSGGERQRLGLAVSFVADVPVFIFDEPSASLDPAATRMLIERARELRRDGRAVLYTTHVAADIDALATRVFPGLVVHAERLSASLARNPMLLTALAPRIGYDRAAAIAKRAAAESRPILEIAVEETGLPREELARILDPVRLARGEAPGD